VGIQPNYFGYCLSLLLAYLIGTVLILRGASRREPSMPPAVASWRLGPLAFAWLTALAVGYMILLNMDLAIRARCAFLSVQLNSICLASLPAIASENENAAPLYEEAFARLHDAFDDEKKIHNPPTGNHEDFDPNEPATIDYLAKHADIIALLRRAAARPACRFDSDLTDRDVNAMVPSLNDSRNAANILSLDAREQIAHGHCRAAIDDAQAIFGLSRHVGERPFLIATLTAAGIDGMANETLKYALPAVKDRDELAGLHPERLTSLARLFRVGLWSEERFGISFYDGVLGLQIQNVAARDNHESTVPPFGRGLQGMIFRVFLLDLDDYMNFMAKLQNSTLQPFYKVKGTLSDSSGTDAGVDLLTSIVAPAFNRVLEILARGEVNDACGQTAVAMTRYRLDHGTLPARLSELVPAYMDSIPIDPFDGKPLRLVIKNGDWIIYSVGPDGVDDGGVGMVKRKGDLTYTLKAATTQGTTRP
jgi:hypothetical protein